MSAPTIWQRLGAFVATAVNLGPDRLASFAASGGSWYVPVMLGDDASGPWNLANINKLKADAAKYNVQVGGWMNGWAGDAETDAARFANCAQAYDLKPLILDLEYAYQVHWAVMPDLVARLRDKLGYAWPIGVSTNSLNASMIYNGRTLNIPRSFYDLGIRVLPQWYNAPAYGRGTWTRPDLNMAWLKANGTTDYNFRDVTGYHDQGLPLSYVHGTLESTGLEGATLADELAQLKTAVTAKTYTVGWSIYLLENTPDSDFALIAGERGKTFLA